MNSLYTFQRPGRATANYYHKLPGAAYIRLLSVQDGHGGGESGSRLHVKLDIFPLGQDTPKFFALSYTWGSPVEDEEYSKHYTSDHDVLVSVSHDDGPFCEQTVGRNLYEAMAQIHKTYWQSYLWADAICVNQMDMHERSSQVSIMGDIYRRADTVIAWLGPNDSDTETIVHLQHDLAVFLKKWKEEAEHEAKPVPAIMYHTKGGSELVTGEEDHLLRIPTAHVRCLWNFFQYRRYFWRGFCLQELALARRALLVLGSHILPEHALEDVHEWVVFNRSALVMTMRRVTGGTVVYKGSLNVYWASQDLRWCNLASERVGHFFSRVYGPLTERALVLARLQFMLCQKVYLSVTNAHDELYSIIGLVNDAREPSSIVQVDYTLPVEEVFMNLAKHLLTELPYLVTFALLCPYKLRKLTGLPSWAPDLTSDYNKPDFAGLLADPDRGGGPGFDAHPVRDGHVIQIEFSGRHLKLYGRYCGEIVSRACYNYDFGRISFSSDLDEVVLLEFSYLRYVMGLALALGPRYKNGQPILEALAQTSVCDWRGGSASAVADNTDLMTKWILGVFGFLHDIVLDGEPEAIQRARELDADALQLLDQLDGFGGLPRRADVETLRHQKAEIVRRFGGSTKDFKLVPPDPAYASVIRPFYRKFTGENTNRAMFRLSNDFVGLASSSVQPGDQVWLLCRAKIPQVLRPLSEKGKYLILGEVYLHGGMDGQLVKDGIL